MIACRGGISGIIGQIISVHIPVNEKRELSLCEVEVYDQGEPYSVSSTSTCPGTLVGCVVPYVENADIGTHGVAKQQVILANRTVRFSCHNGYNLRENASHPTIVDLHCLSNSSWDKAKPECVPQTCTVDRLNTGGFPGRRINYNHGENITFTCNPGYEKEYESYWCDRGTALPTNPLCVLASCNAPNLPDHMISSQSHFAHDSLLTVSCEYGFRLSTNQEQPRCLYGVWSRSLDVTCQRVSCPVPGINSLSTVEALSIPGIRGYVHGARVRYSCIEGWEIQGIAERECDNGLWTGSPPACRIAAPPRCMLPERSNGERYYVTGYTGNIFDEGLPIGERAHISVRCNPGSVPQSAVSTTCLNRGVWSVSVPICVRMQRLCSKPGYISRVVQYVNGLEINELTSYPHDELPEGTFLLSHCSLPGQYVLQGSANRTCSEGRWTGVEPRCVASETRITFQNNQPLEIRSDGTIVIYPFSQLFMYCRLPSNINKAVLFASDSGLSGYYWAIYGRSFAVMRLNPPETSHSGRFTCRSNDNSLSHSVVIQFAAIHCDRPIVPTNGTLHDYDYGWKNGTYYMGKLITYTCNRGYSLDGERRITCVFGQWSDPAPRCRRATCPELQPPTHGTKIGGNRIGDSVMIGCNYGYQLQGETFLDCLESGEWSHPLPNCTVAPVIAQPCDLVTCEVWQKCVIDSSNVGVCRCISPYDCPETEEPEVCGTDGRNYISICHLKALACLWNTGVDVASSNWYCINGVPERTQAPPTFPTNFNPGELSSSSSFDDYVLRVNPDAPSIPEPTLPANSGPVEPDTSTSRQPVHVVPRSYPFCDAGVCPAGYTAELWRNATAIIIAFANDWQADLRIMTMQIYEVISGELPQWTENSDQEVFIDDGGVSERGCMCPSFQSDEPVIIRFSQNLRPDGKGQLLGTDIVLPYSSDLYQEITWLLQEPIRTPAPQEPHQQEVSGSVSSSFSSSEGDQGTSHISSESDAIPTTNDTEITNPPPGSSESSYDSR